MKGHGEWEYSMKYIATWEIQDRGITQPDATINISTQDRKDIWTRECHYFQLPRGSTFRIVDTLYNHNIAWQSKM